MAVEKADLLEIDGEKYITLAVLSYEGANYAFTNKITENEEVTEDFYIFREYYNGYDKIVDENIINMLLPKFQKMVKEDLKKLMSE